MVVQMDMKFAEVALKDDVDSQRDEVTGEWGQNVAAAREYSCWKG